MQIGAYTKIPMCYHPYDLKGNRKEKKKEKEKLDGLKCSPGSDIESQDLLKCLTRSWSIYAYYFNIFCKAKYSYETYRPNNLMLQAK